MVVICCMFSSVPFFIPHFIWIFRKMEVGTCRILRENWRESYLCLICNYTLTQLQVEFQTAVSVNSALWRSDCLSCIGRSVKESCFVFENNNLDSSAWRCQSALCNSPTPLQYLTFTISFLGLKTWNSWKIENDHLCNCISKLGTYRMLE